MTVLFVCTAAAVLALAEALRAAWGRRSGRALRALLATEARPGAVRAVPGGRPRADPASAAGTLPFPFGYLNRRLRQGAVAVSLQTAALLAVAGAVLAWASAATLVGAGHLADLAVPAGLWAPVLWIDRLAARRREAVAEEMERAAVALESAVAAGMNAYEAVLDVGVSSGGILGAELVRTIADADRVGMSEALSLLGQRLPLPEVQLLIASMRLNQAAGAELGATLTGLGRTLRERREAALALRAATAAGRWQAGMLVAVPPLLLFFMRYAYPSFETPLFATATGQMLLLLAACWLLVGHVVVHRMSVPRAEA